MCVPNPAGETMPAKKRKAKKLSQKSTDAIRRWLEREIAFALSLADGDTRLAKEAKKDVAFYRRILKIFSRGHYGAVRKILCSEAKEVAERVSRCPEYVRTADHLNFAKLLPVVDELKALRKN